MHRNAPWTAAALLCLLAAAVLLPFATAEPGAADAGCTSSSPCVWEVDLDAFGFAGVAAAEPLQGSVGDWYVIAATNLDDVPHDLALERFGVAFTAYPFDDVESTDSLGATRSEPFYLDGAGASILVDATADAEALVEVAEDPFFAPQPGPQPSEGADDAGDPGPEAREVPAAAMAPVLATLVGVAAAARRRS